MAIPEPPVFGLTARERDRWIGRLDEINRRAGSLWVGALGLAADGTPTETYYALRRETAVMQHALMTPPGSIRTLMTDED